MHYTSVDVYKFISKQTHDPIVERKTCATSGTQFPIFQSDLDFYGKISPTFNGVKYGIPAPSLCPEERSRRRMARRNERSLYKRKCDATGKTVISMYSPNKPHRVFDRDIRRSDQCENSEHRKEYDPSKPFMDQFYDLLLEVPLFSLYHMSTASINSDYSNHVLDSKDCYMCFSLVESEKCLYCNNNDTSTYCVDCMNIQGCQQSYACVDCVDCMSCYYCTDCTNCSYCIGCYGLTGKQYYINNQQFTKEAWEKANKNTKQRKKEDQNNWNIHSENSFGSHIVHSSHMRCCFDIHDMEHGAYNQRSLRSSYAYDSYGLAGGELNLELQSGRGYKLAFGAYCYDNTDCYYTHSCFANKYLFGCIGLRNKQYCILNKQYTKEEYENLVPLIIESMREDNTWGSFFEASKSPFGYNETVAHDYFPLDEETALQSGYNRESISYDPDISSASLVDMEHISSISMINDSILKQILVCKESGRPYRLVKEELDFYRKHNLDIPVLHPDIRHKKRITSRNTYTFTP